MPTAPTADAPPTNPPPEEVRTEDLLRVIEEAAGAIGRSNAACQSGSGELQQQLAESRLGMATALFTALRSKNPSAAEHSLRVALGCSAWAAALEMPDKLRTQLEVAALLHDIGKIAVPDAILAKPGRLTDAERETMNMSRAVARRILSDAGAPDDVIEGVATASAWYDGSNKAVPLSGEQTSFVARMIAIVDAFDSMTTDQVWRPAKSRERAIATLYEQAGTQFDPELVASYRAIFEKDQRRLEADIAQRWLGSVTAGSALPWEPTWREPKQTAAPGATTPAAIGNDLFAATLIDKMHDAVVFVDARRLITHWNTGAERMTGIGATAAIGKELSPSLLDMSSVSGDPINEEECPLAQAINDGLPSLERVNIVGRNGQNISIELHIVPVSPSGRPGDISGGAVLMRDVSDETSLEERCQALSAEITKDPMTQVANRAEFDRMLSAFVEAHLDTDLSCSLIMADIDHFKSINDTFGHQAGDMAIMTFANLMKSLCRSGDVVARYGGEEFAILCADCSNATAAKRAEVIRKKLAETPHGDLGGKHITASFGVTELQPGDTPETLLRRSDRALLMAKDQGRNQVVQLGDGMEAAERSTGGLMNFTKWILGPLGRSSGATLVDTRLVTNVPVELAIDKLRGFIADRDAYIVKTAENYLRLTVEQGGRGDDGPATPFDVELRLSQEHIERTNTAGLASGKYVHTYIDVTIQSKRDRDRRKGSTVDRARSLQSNLQSYLMAKEVEAESAAT